MIEVYISNYGKFAKNKVCGEFISLPATKEDLKSLFARIGVDGVLEKRFLITDFEPKLSETDHIFRHPSIDELNYYATLLNKLDKFDREKYRMVSEYLTSSHETADMINDVLNLECYDFYPGICDYESFGRYLINELKMEKLPKKAEKYIDYDAYGRYYLEVRKSEITLEGVIMENDSTFIEYYNGRDVPDEYKIFAYPDPPKIMPVKQQLKMFGNMAITQMTFDNFVPMPAREQRAEAR